MMDTELGKTTQAWHPVIFTARDGLSVERVGELDLKYRLEELVILMSSDYSEIRKVTWRTSMLTVAITRFPEWRNA